MAKRTLAIILALAMAAFMSLAFTACGNDDAHDHHYDTTGAEALSIVGSWNWNGEVYYVFNPNHTGTRDVSGMFEAPSAIAWTIQNGVLVICSTPGADACNVLGHGHLHMEWCIEPELWDFTLTANSLTIRSQQAPGVEFTYTR